MPDISISIENLQQVQFGLNNLAAQIQDPGEKLLNRLGETAIEDIDQRFMTRGYGTWPPLSPATIARKHGNAMVLIDTGAMFQSTRMNRMSEGQISVEVPYGGKDHDPDVPKKHQEGIGVPQRKIIEVTPKLTEALNNTVGKWIIDMLMAFGKAM